jgi:hypothetical protein
MEKSSEKKTEAYTIKKNNSFHSIDNPIRTNMRLFRSSTTNSKDTMSNHSVLLPPASYINELEQSMLELKNFIEIVAPSNSETIETITNQLSFRPKNLPKKSKEEEEYHRRLVEENRKSYLESLHKKHMKEIEYKQRLEKKYIKQQKLSNIWINEIIPNWIEKKKDKKIKEYFYMGIPPNVRGRVWMLCLGNKFSITKEYYQIQVNNSKEILQKYKVKNQTEQNDINENIYIKKNKDKDKNKNKHNKDINNNIEIEKIDNDDEDYLNEDSKCILGKDKERSISIIELDIERTFPYLGVFKGHSPMAEDLREILRVFVISRPDIGYIQGLSFIAGILLLNMDKFKAFISLMNLILNPIILPFYKMDNESIQQRLKLFKQVFYFNLPELCQHFDELDLLPENYYLSWNMTLFTRDVNLELVNRIWDVFMIEGVKAIYSAAIVFLSHFEEKLMNMDFVEIMTCIGSIKTINFDEDMFVEAMKKVTMPDWIQLEIDKLNDSNIPIY